MNVAVDLLVLLAGVVTGAMLALTYSLKVGWRGRPLRTVTGERTTSTSDDPTLRHLLGELDAEHYLEAINRERKRLGFPPLTRADDADAETPAPVRIRT